jgi:mRNA-degrading endonuclease RelE of RelBE toxin-antitoxin system
MWTAKYLKEAISDLKKLDPSVQKIVLAGKMRVAQNPLPAKRRRVW